MTKKKPQIATSISIPKETLHTVTYKKCQRKLAHISNQKVILLCLRKYLKLYQTQKFDDRATCRYNRQKSNAQLKIKLNSQEHHNLKMNRLLLQLSASYLCYLAIEQFLGEILDLLEAAQGANAEDASNELDILLESMNAIHRKIAFRAKNIARLIGMMASYLPSCLIVMPRLSQKRYPHKNSGHQGRPYNQKLTPD